MIASPTIGVDYVAGKFRAAEDEGDAPCFRGAAKGRQPKRAGRSGNKIALVRLVRSPRFPYVIKKTYAPDAAGSVV